MNDIADISFNNAGASNAAVIVGITNPDGELAKLTTRGFDPETFCAPMFVEGWRLWFVDPSPTGVDLEFRKARGRKPFTREAIDAALPDIIEKVNEGLAKREAHEIEMRREAASAAADRAINSLMSDSLRAFDQEVWRLADKDADVLAAVALLKEAQDAAVKRIVKTVAPDVRQAVDLGEQQTDMLKAMGVDLNVVNEQTRRAVYQSVDCRINNPALVRRPGRAIL